MLIDQNKPQADSNSGGRQEGNAVRAPSISLPKGGGAIRGIDEKFSANPATGTGSLTIPLALSPGRSGFGPQLALHYDSGTGNGPFGMGWSLSMPIIARRTDKGLPRYRDDEESDTFVLSGAEDLVPVLVKDAQGYLRCDELEREGYCVKRYRPRVVLRGGPAASEQPAWLVRYLERDSGQTVHGSREWLRA
jgi:hypothetical protein